MKKKIFIIGTAIACMLPMIFPFSAQATESTISEPTIYTGTCAAEGSDVTWEYNATEQIMTFSGTGEMPDYIADWEYDKAITPEWKQGEFTYNPKQVIIGDGITKASSLTDLFAPIADWDGTVSMTAGEDLLGYSTSDSGGDAYWGVLSKYDKRKIRFYGYYGSNFYYFVPGKQFVGLGVAENPVMETSGTTEDGMTWDFHYDTATMYLSGNGSKMTSTKSGYPAKIGGKTQTFVFAKDFIPPEDDSIIEPYPELNHSSYLYERVRSSKKVYCYQGSAFDIAYQRMLNNELVEGMVTHPAYYVSESALLGDVNLDGEVDLKDAVLLNKCVNGSVTYNEIQKANMDCNGDGVISADDSLTLLKFLIQLINQL